MFEGRLQKLLTARPFPGSGLQWVSKLTLRRCRGTKVSYGCFVPSKSRNEVVMTEFRIQADSEYAKSKRRGFGWVAGSVIMAIVFGLVLGIDRERTLVHSNDSATSPMMASGNTN